ncbi:MAG TPA: L-threonylcarbamoyladenylate synthase [Solirubrobacteraceae bacterium]|nr:L-threonylcarbamoyladenylate synthase [Solirubrobacteraceae bacterium]
MSLTPEDAARLQACLQGDGVAVIPTDTVYGLACNPESVAAIRRVYELKGRPPAKPAAIMFFSLAPALGILGELGPRTRGALRALLPGPVTLLLPNPKQRFPLACNPSSSASALLGLRVPALDDGPLAALATVEAPAAQSSANLSGGADARRLTDVPVEIRAGADLVLDGGELPGTASTVIDLADYERSGAWRVVREGPLNRAAVERLLG